jgi:hypothetical protein
VKLPRAVNHERRSNMDLSGNLSVIDPSLVFQIFHLSDLTGLLRFITEEKIACCYFKKGDLLYATMDTQTKKIGKFLIERGYITEEQLNDALLEFATKEESQRIGNILIEKGYLDRKSLVSAIQEQMKEVVFEVLHLTKGYFIFFSGVEPKNEDILLDVKLDHLILEGLKRIDEARKA